MLSSRQTIVIAGEEMTLHGLKAVFWVKQKTLLLSDVHIGKVAHFRNNGIPIPAISAKNNYWNLSVLIEEFQPLHLIVIGDLTHSKANIEWEEFKDFMAMFPNLKKTVVIGNHDNYKSKAFVDLDFSIVETLELGPFKLIHEPQDSNTTDPNYYYLSGHIHPGIKLQGPAKTSLTLPCFYFGQHQGILPAFGAFTGFVPIKAQKRDRIYAISEGNIIDLTANKSTP